jgi:hypothetical protein
MEADKTPQICIRINVIDEKGKKNFIADYDKGEVKLWVMGYGL